MLGKYENEHPESTEKINDEILSPDSELKPVNAPGDRQWRFASSRPASEAEINRARAGLRNWATTIAGPDDNDFTDNIEIFGVERKSIFDVEIDTQTETRSIEEKYYRLTGSGDIAKPTIDKNSLNVWSVTLPYYDDGPEGNAEAEFDKSRKVVTCAFCKGAGRSNCSSCSGTGKMVCPDCGGSGYVTCPWCNGSGYKPYPHNLEQCNLCFGRLKIRCRRCAENVYCDAEALAAIGAGRPVDPRGIHITGASMPVACDSCGGSGSETCGNCSGTGKVLCVLAVKGVRQKSIKNSRIMPPLFPDFPHASFKPEPVFKVTKKTIGGDDMADFDPGIKSEIFKLLNEIKYGLSKDTRIRSQSLSLSCQDILLLSYGFQGKRFETLVLQDDSLIMNESPLGGKIDDLNQLIKKANDDTSGIIGNYCLVGLICTLVLFIALWVFFGFLKSLLISVGIGLVGMAIIYFTAKKKAKEVFDMNYRSQISHLALKLAISPGKLKEIIDKDAPDLNDIW